MGATRTVSLIGLALTLLALCQRSAPAAPPAPRGSIPAALERTVESGETSLSLRADKAEMGAAERLRVELMARVGRGYNAEFPTAGEKLGDFGIVSSVDRPVRLTVSGGLEYVREYLLEPFLPGDYTIPAIVVGFRSTATGQASELRTEPLTVRVTSLLAQDESPNDTGDYRGVVEPDATATNLLRMVLGAVAAALAGLSCVVWLVRRRRARNPPGKNVESRLLALRARASTMGAPAICDQVAELVRTCLSRRCNPLAAGMTTDEVVRRRGRRCTSSWTIFDRSCPRATRFASHRSPWRLTVWPRCWTVLPRW